MLTALAVSPVPPVRCLYCLSRREMATKYDIKYFYDIKDRSNFKANPDYKGVCHVALAQVGVGDFMGALDGV